MSTKETRVGNDAGVSRCDIRENERHNRICLSVFDDERDQKRERDIRATERASSYTLTFLVRFCFPAGEILFADRNS